LLQILFETLGILYLTTSVNTILLVPTVLFFLVFIVLRRYYLKVGTALKRMDASSKILQHLQPLPLIYIFLAKGPIIAYFDSALEGLTTIKAFQAENLLIDKFDEHQNLYTSASYSYLCCMRAFVFMGENMTAIFICFVILQFLIFDDGILPGDVGLALSQAFMMSVPLQFAIYKWAELETQVTSVERVFEYTNIKQESKSGLVLSNWLTLGEIKYENVSLSLNNKKSYLMKNISLLIKPGEKVGIVGRTGAGKSSLISVLFRLYEFEGKISIDGIDIKTLSLDTLRSNISVIPQDPVLFDGTFRENIDPEKLCKDDEIWNVVKVLDLKEIISNLDLEITDSDFTFGQKQLICLGRILLNPKKVVIFDEISEHVDPKTENLICELIDNYLTSCTVVKIAHRMKFILSCDKIFVLDDGEVVEHDHPQTLLRNVDGLFSKLVKVSGVNLEHE
jgi:ATP-binding cassette subfamily C (CFTR/MRP) protein 4